MRVQFLLAERAIINKIFYANSATQINRRNNLHSLAAATFLCWRSTYCRRPVLHFGRQLVDYKRRAHELIARFLLRSERLVLENLGETLIIVDELCERDLQNAGRLLKVRKRLKNFRVDRLDCSLPIGAK